MSRPKAWSSWVTFPWCWRTSSARSAYGSWNRGSVSIGRCGSCVHTARKNGFALSRFVVSQSIASSTTSGAEKPRSFPTGRPSRTKLTGSLWLGAALFWVAIQCAYPWSPGCGWAGSLNRPLRCHLPTWQVA